MDQFIGDRKIRSIVEGEKVRVAFEDDSSVTLAPRMFEASVTHEPIDASKLQIRRALAVQAVLMQLLLDWDMKLSDIHPLLQWSSNYINDKHELADEKLWGNTAQERTIGDLESVLSRKPN